MIHNWEEDVEVHLLDEVVVDTFKGALHFNLLNDAPKPKSYDSCRLLNFHNLDSQPPTLDHITSILDMLLPLTKCATDQETIKLMKEHISTASVKGYPYFDFFNLLSFETQFTIQNIQAVLEDSVEEHVAGLNYFTPTTNLRWKPILQDPTQ